MVTYTLGQSVWENFALLFFLQENFWGCIFCLRAAHPQWEGGEASAPYVLQARVLSVCINFSGDAQEFFANVCTCAHLRMCLLHCMHASSFALAF